ncbi:LacI family DNA-binding transcriptional regulator [Streptomyces sp. CMB-StM0423]|uniref:LacI family DNA-binding transcriptional regulator n=1 Tax=Streptomyces sp. CMB-StM0423 TaxID=2059884 RepID=UPI0018FE053C|nr:LacI family DNA-binding transcriptional regulator [Streptomyces sp. CMB-StM0423]
MARNPGQGRSAAGAPATISDVAAAAGVSRQTVSNVVNVPERVGAETRERVQRVIAELDYRPNRLARSLRASSPGMVGYRIQPVVSGSVASVQDGFLHALAEAGRASDRHVLLFTADGPEDESEYCQSLWRSGTVSSVVLYDIAPHDERPGRLAAAGVPFAAFGRTAAGTEAYSWVDVDNAAGVSAAVDHLVSGGHGRIGFLGWPEGTSVGDARAQGWVTAMDRNGLLADSHRLDVRGPDTMADGTRLMAELLDRPKPPTAVVAATDTLAVGALQALRDRGVRPGQDVGVVGFDDTAAAAALGLSSVRQPIQEVGRTIMAELLRLTTGTKKETEASQRAEARGKNEAKERASGPDESSGPLQLLLEPELVVRSSSTPAAR